MKAKAMVTDGHGNFEIKTIEVGEPGPGEVAVQLKASGVCHTDYDSLKWGRPYVMGHEGAGVVTAIGEGVTTCGVGDRVLLNWAIPCGRCFQCLEGNHAICEVNNSVTARDPMAGHARPEATRLDGKPIPRSFNIGTMSEHTVVKEEAIVRMTVDIPFTSACIVGCGVMTGFGSAVNAAKVRPGSSCVVLGVGGVGLNVVQGCRVSGASKIIAIDVNANRLEISKRFGATHTIQADREDAGLIQASKKVKELTGGRGADYAFECTAIPALGAAPLAMVRNAGTAVQVSGIEQEITIDMNLFEWDKVYLNPLYGKCRPQIDLPKLLDHYATGDLLLDELVTRTYPLEELGQAFEDMHHGRNAKGVLVMGE